MSLIEDTDNQEPPEDSAVFETSDGKKVRLRYEMIFSYVGKTKNSTTTVEYGYYDNKESFVLDIDFDTLDAKLTQYRKDVKDYWKSRNYD
jgi:hypothetical protein